MSRWATTPRSARPSASPGSGSTTGGCRPASASPSRTPRAPRRSSSTCSKGTPDVWLDGRLHRLRPGDAVGFPAGTGIAHTFINNCESEARLLVVGEAWKDENRIVYPVNPERRPRHDDWWEDAPARPLGPHDGRPERR